MDGARFANALVHLNCSPAEATWKRGVDVLSLGATKNGALCAEAVVFFDPSMAGDFARRRKRAGHLWSKMRFLSAQLLAYLDQRAVARQCAPCKCHGDENGAGFEVGGGRRSCCIRWRRTNCSSPCPKQPWRTSRNSDSNFTAGRYRSSTSGVAIRLVTSYATSSADVDEFIGAAQGLR